MLILFAIAFLFTMCWEYVDPPELGDIQSTVGAEKVNEFDLVSDSYDTIIVGSSRIYRQVDPLVVEGNATNTRVYNFGSPSTFAPRSIFLAQELAERYPDKHVVLELCELEQFVSYSPKDAMIDVLTGSKFEDPAVAYSAHPRITKRLYADFLVSLETGERRGEALFDSIQYTMATSLRSLGLGRRWLYVQRDARDMSWIRGRSGFASLETELRELGTETLKERHQSLAKSKGFEKDIRRNKESSDSIVAERGFAELYRDFLELEKTRHGQCLILLPTRPDHTNPKIVSYASIIPDEKLIDLSEPSAVGVNEIEFWFDRGHLNDQGVAKFSTILGQELNRRLRSQGN